MCCDIATLSEDRSLAARLCAAPQLLSLLLLQLLNETNRQRSFTQQHAIGGQEEGVPCIQRLLQQTSSSTAAQ